MLKKYYKTEKININLSKKEYDLYQRLNKKYTKKYCAKLKLLKEKERLQLREFNYKKEISLINEHNLLIKKILKELYIDMPILKKYNVTIFLTGSFARYSNKLNSDVDIHFVYSNIIKPIIWKYEEMYFSIMSNILEIERNNLHSVITTKLNKNKLVYFDNLNDNKYLIVNLKNDNKIIKKCKFYPVTKKRFFLQYDNNKSFKAFKNYITKERKGLNREWSYNFYPVSNVKNFEKKYNNLFNIKRNDKIKYLINQLRSKIIDESISNNEIKEIKKLYQQKTFSNIFNTLNIFRMIYLNNQYFHLQDILNSNEFKKIEKYGIISENIYEYLWLIKKISVYCDENCIPYSIHKSSNITIEFIGVVKEKYLVINKNLEVILNYLERSIDER